MGRTDAIKDKILKLGSKQKLGALLKYADNAEDDVRMTVAMAMGMIPNYESGMALIPLLRDSSPMVRAAAATAAKLIDAAGDTAEYGDNIDKMSQNRHFTHSLSRVGLRFVTKRYGYKQATRRH